MNRVRPCILRTLLVLAYCLVAAPGAAGGAADEPVPAHEVFQLRVEDGGLVLRTTMPPTPADEFQTVELAGVGGSAEVTNSGGGGGTAAHEAGRAVVPNLFKLEVSNNDRPGQRVGLLVSWHDGTLDVQRSVHYTGANRYTRLTRLLASRNPEFGTGPSVQLMVNENGDVGREPLELYLREADFFTLRRKHPAAADEHLRPLLRELGQEAVFAPEPRVAWQVFADRWQPDDALVRAVKQLLPRLDADDARDREAASVRVAELGQEAVLVLMQLDRTPLSAEQNSRIDVLIADHTPLDRAEAERLRADVPFLLDCLNGDDPRTRAAALDLLRQAVSEPVEFDTRLAVPARGASVAALREKLAADAP